jgi:hypothetical protein
MSKVAIGARVENVADDRESGTVVVVFPTLHGSFGDAVDTDGYGVPRFFTEQKPAFTVTRRETA